MRSPSRTGRFYRRTRRMAAPDAPRERGMAIVSARLPRMDGMEHQPDEPPEVPLGDVLGDVPLFREIQRVLLSSSGPINWELARQVGIAMASWGTDDPPPTETDQREIRETVRMAELAVADFTALPFPGHVADVHALRRAQWVEANIDG